jgi:serine/threonine-protein kinase
MASVYLGRDRELERPVAVKLFAESLAADDALRRRFLRESRLAARLAHPNVVNVYDAGEDGGVPFIVMEYVEGETVAELLRRRGRLEPAEAVAIVAQACAGLEHAHRAGVVHRDVKPQNLLLTPDGVVKVADFGIALAAESTRLTEAGALLGTAAYLAPEQAHDGEITPATDVYSLGVVLYELLTGRTPYAVDSVADLTKPRPPPPVGDLPPALGPVVARALAADPAERPASAGELARELGGAPEGPTVPLVTPYRTRRRGLAVAAAAALAALGIALGVVLTTAGGTKRAPAQQVEPLPRAQNPGLQARELARWLRRYSAPQ